MHIQSGRCCIYWLNGSSQACQVCERQSIHSSHTPFCFDSRWCDGDRSLIGRGVVDTPPFVGPFCTPLDAQSTGQSRHTDLLTPRAITPSAVVVLGARNHVEYGIPNATLQTTTVTLEVGYRSSSVLIRISMHELLGHQSSPWGLARVYCWDCKNFET